MIYLVSGAGSLQGYSEHIGTMLSPRTRGLAPLKEKRKWAADNDAFHGKFEKERFNKHLKRLLPYQEQCLFVVCPDVVCNAEETAKLYERYAPEIEDLDYPVAWVAQNGALPRDIPDCQAVFIGGDTQWKLGSQALAIGQEAKRRGLWLHIGRVNSKKRCKFAYQMQADSVDGTYTAFRGHHAGLRNIEQWLIHANQEQQLRLL